MSEAKGTSSAAAAAGTKKGTGFELRLEAAKAFVCLTDREVTAGARLVELALEVPDVKFPFEVGQGAGQFRLRLCDLARIEVEVSPPFLATLISKLDLAPAGIASLQLAFRAGFAEGAGQLEGGVPFTFKAGILPAGDQGLSFVVYDARLYGAAFLPAAALPNLLTRAIGSLAQPDGASFELTPLPLLLRRLLPARGWKVPRTGQVRLTAARLEPGLLRLVWDRDHSGPADAPAEQELLAAVEGARAFRAAEVLLARSEWEPAREAYLAAGASAAAHPFAVSRLLSLLAMEERFQEEALDLAAEWRGRRPDFVPAMAAEAVLRAQRGEPGRAAAAFADLAAAALKRGEELSALAAAEACFAQGEQADPAPITRAVEIALSLRRDHLPALRALLTTAEQTDDRESLLRACRRLAAYAPDGAEKARAHARLGELLLSSDPPSARLHLDQALRMAPDDAETLAALGRACERAGEHLRAARAHDRLRDIFIQRSEHGAAAREALAVGTLWETQLDHPENALLRYREACELDPSSIEARECAARLADQLGHWPEAADHYSALLSALDPSQPGSAERAARAHRALAAVAESRLDDPSRAASHLESVLASEPHDPSALERLSKLYRKLDRPAELLAILDRLAPLAPGPTERAALLSEAGQLALDRLHLQEAARSRFAAALTLDPRCRPALLGLIDLAAAQNDGRAERDGLERLVSTVRDRAEQATHHDRIAVVSERMGDLAAAFRAVAAARNAAPSLQRLGEAVRVARRMGSEAVLSGLLAEQAIAARSAGESSLAAAAWLERARLLAPSDLSLARAAVSEARTLLPLDPAGLRLEAELAERTGDGPATLRALQALLAAAPDDAKALELRAGRAALLAGDLAAARAHADRAIALGEREAENVLEEVLDRTGDRTGQAELSERTGRWLQAARLWIADQEPLRARKALDQAAREPGTAAEALGLLAELSLTAGDSGAAAAAFMALAPLGKGREGARLAFRAAALDPSRALEALELAIRCDPAYAPARASRADRLLEQTPARALEDAEAALAVPEADPDAPAADLRAALQRLAATAASHAGAAEPARRHLAAYCAQAPDDDAALAELIDLHRKANALPDLAAALALWLDRAGRADAGTATAARLELARLLAGPLARPADARPLLAELLSQPNPSEELVRAAFDPRLSPLVDSARRAQLALRFAGLPDVDPEQAAAALSERASHLSEDPAPADWTEALETARKLVQLAPRHPVALDLLARAAAASHLPEEAARALLSRAELARERREPDAASRSVAAGRAALAAGFGASPAADALRAAVQLGVNGSDAAPLLAELLADPNPSDDLVRTAFDPLFAPLVDPVRRAQLALRFAALPGVAPADAAAALAERAMHLSGGPAPADWSEALETARRLVQLSPRDPVALDLLARAATALQRPEEAAQALLARAEIARSHGEPDAASRLVAAGHAALAAGLGSDVASGALRTALHLKVNHAEAAPLLGELLADPSPSGELIRTAFDPLFAPLIDPARRGRLALRFASLPGVAPAEAVAALAAQVAFLSDGSEPLDWTEALQTARALVQLSPGHPAGLDLLARAALSLEHLEEAAQALLARAERSRAQAEPDVAARYAAACRAAIGAGLGNEAAVEVLRTAVELGLDREQATPLLAEMLADPSPSDALVRAAFDPLFAPWVDPARRAQLAFRFAALPGVAPADAAAALTERAKRLTSGPEPTDWGDALETARRLLQAAPRDPAALELLAQAATALGQPVEAARALLVRADLARTQAEPDAASRLAAAGHAALAAGLEHATVVEALRGAVQLGLDRDEARAVWTVLAGLAARQGDAAAERSALEALVPLLRTGDKPARLLRLSALALADRDLEAARRFADDARQLGPRELAAVEACRLVALELGDLSAVVECLDAEAALDPDRAGAKLLERARVLAGPLGRLDDADQAYDLALAKLPPDGALALEQVRLRRRASPPVHLKSWSEPIERFARRVTDRRASAVAFLRAATLALAQGDSEAGLRCARTAYARSQGEPTFAGPLLARVLYQQGAAGEALVLHQRLFDEARTGIDEGDQVSLCRQLAELAEDHGDRDLALAALDRLLVLRPQDAEAAERRFELDPDRARAVKSLAQVAGASRSGRARLRALLRAAASAYGELHDAPRAGALWRRARVEAGGTASLAAAVENARLEAIRGDSDPFSPQIPAEQVEALEDAAAAWKEVGELETAARLLEEAADLHSRYGRFAEAARDLEQLEELALERSDPGRAAGYARAAGLVLLDHAGDLDGAELAIRRAVSHEPSRDTWRLLEAIARARGSDGVPLLVEALSAQAELSEDPLLRANTLVTLAAVQEASLGDLDAAAAALERALADVPGLPGAEEPLLRIFRSQGHLRPLAELLLTRAARLEDPAERCATRREAAELLEGLSDPEDLTLAAESYALASTDAPEDTDLSRAAARLLVELGRREEAIPHLAALVRADPDDEAAARELAQAFAGRHRERADLFLARASKARGEPRSARLREAAKALFAAGDDVRARALLREAYDAWPADDAAFLAAIRDAAADIDRLDAVLGGRAAAVPAEAAGCHRARADALLAFGRVGEAERAYEACLVAAPDDAGALAMLAECRAEHEGDEAAASADARLCAVAEANAGSVTPSVEARARYRLGLSAWAHGRPSEGIAHLERALALAPEDARAGLAWAALANGHAARGNGDAALSAARARVVRAERLNLASEKSEALEAGAALAAQFGDHGSDTAVLLEELATVRVTQGGEPDPSTDALVERAAAALLRGGESTRAEALLTLAARASRGMRRADLFLRLADGARSRGEHAAARAARAEADAADPAGATLRLGPLEDVKASGDLTAYAAALEQALAAPGSDAAACTLELARTRTRLGDSAGAAKTYEALLDMGPEARGFAEASAALVSHYEQSGDAQALAAVHTRRATAAITAQERAAAHLAAAAVLERSSADSAEIRGALEQACEADPDDVVPWLARASFESRSGDPLSAARAHLAVAIRAEKGEASQAALEAARLFESLGRTADASRAYTAAIHADPRCLPARRVLAKRALEQGDPAGAAAHLAAIPDAELPPSERPTHLRALAQALQAAGREAGPAWRAAFDADPGDLDAFEILTRGTKIAGDLETWLELAQAHRAALMAAGDTARREALDLERADVLTSLGRSEASMAPPEREQPQDGLVLPRAPEPASWPTSADADPFAQAAARESRATEPGIAGVQPGPDEGDAPAAAIEPRRVAIIPPREPNPLEAALAGARMPPDEELVPGSEPISVAELEIPDAPPARTDTDVVADVLRAQANASDDSARADYLERLATHLERKGDRSGAADALRDALETDPDRDLTYSRLLSIASGDRERFVAAVKLRASRASNPATRSAALCDLGQMLVQSRETYSEALTAFRFALELDPASAEASRGLEAARVALAEVGELPPPVPPHLQHAASTEPPAPPLPLPAPAVAAHSVSNAPPLELESALEAAALQAELSPAEGQPEPASLEPTPPPDPVAATSESTPPLSDLPWESAPESPAVELPASEPTSPEPPALAEEPVPDLAEPPAPALSLEAEEPPPPLSDLPWQLPPESPTVEPAAFEATSEPVPDFSEPPALALSLEAEEPPPSLSDLPWQTFPEPAFTNAAAELATALPEDSAAQPGAERQFLQVESPEQAAARVLEEIDLDLSELDIPVQRGAPADAPSSVRSEPPSGLDVDDLPPDLPSFDLDLASEPHSQEPTVNAAAAQDTALPAASAPSPAGLPGLEEEPSLPGRVDDWNFSDLTAAASSAAAQAEPPLDADELPPPPAPAAEETSPTPEAPAPFEGSAPPDAEAPDEPALAEQCVARAWEAEEAQETERARELYEQAWAADPHSVPALTGLCRICAISEGGDRLLELTHALETLAGPSALEPFGAAIGRAYLAIGDLESGHAWLEATWAASPSDLTVAQDLCATAETLGRFDEVIQLGDILASGFAESDPASAVAYYRHSGEVARDHLADPDRAAIFFEKALALAPDDADLHRALMALQAPSPEAAPQSLAAALDLARRTPFDGDALTALAALARQTADGERSASEAGRLRELARAASGLAGFVSPGLQAPESPRPATHVTPELRDRAAFPSPLAETGRLVTLLCPFLEPLFPANLARRSVTAQDRISERRAPTLHERLGLTARVLGCRPYAAFLSQSTSCEVPAENTQPPALVLGVGAVAALAPSALAFLLARSLVLLDHGWALLGKFSPRDVAILCELACRFAGGRPPSLGLPPERAGAFLTVLERSVPGSVRAQAKTHAQRAAEELAHFDASTFTEGIVHSANRMAVLYTGDPRGALEALSRLGHAEGIAADLADPAQVLARPEPADLVRFVLSDLYLELRGAVLV